MNDMDNMKDKVISEFRRKYGDGEMACYFAPGRVNLIGEHTDYNGGHVFPCAITFGTYVAVRKRDDDLLRLSSVNFPSDGVKTSSIRDLVPLSEDSWTAYVSGVIWEVRNRIKTSGAADAAISGASIRQASAGSAADAASVATDGASIRQTSACSAADAASVATDGASPNCDAPAGPGTSSQLTGMDIMIGGDVPAGAGLSSSASLEVAVGYMLNDQFGLGLSNVDIALIGQAAENNYVGVSCGIMDQFASAMGKKDHAIFLDTNTLEYEYVPLSLDDCSIIITNTNKPHSLNDSAYNDRRRECAEALAEMNKLLSNDSARIDALCKIDQKDFDRVKEKLSNDVIMRRARHAVTEDQRTRDAVDVLRRGDISAFGGLMNASHVSLRDDYQVSCAELDLLAETAWGVPGVLGSRMTGGGFGGCTVSIIKTSSVDEYESAAGEKYRDAFGYDCAFIRASAGPGPSRVE